MYLSLLFLLNKLQDIIHIFKKRKNVSLVLIYFTQIRMEYCSCHVKSVLELEIFLHSPYHLDFYMMGIAVLSSLTMIEVVLKKTKKETLLFFFREMRWKNAIKDVSDFLSAIFLFNVFFSSFTT